MMGFHLYYTAAERESQGRGAEGDKRNESGTQNRGCCFDDDSFDQRNEKMNPVNRDVSIEFIFFAYCLFHREYSLC